jgi:hypothetical protein
LPPRELRFEIVSNPRRDFDTPETQGQAIALACDWFQQHLLPKEADNEHH